MPVVDINILRLYARVTGRKVQQPDICRNPWVWVLAEQLLPDDLADAREDSYGLLDNAA